MADEVSAQMNITTTAHASDVDLAAKAVPAVVPTLMFIISIGKGITENVQGE